MESRELTINTRHLQFAALELGNPEGKPVLALHGWLDNAASFTPLFGQMSEQMPEAMDSYRIIAIDLAGHGLSQHRPEGWSYDIWHYVEDLVDIVEALNLDSFFLMGHSMGAVICTMAAATVLKEQIRGMVLIDGLSPTPRQPDQAPATLTQYIQQRRTPVSELSVTRYRSPKQAIRARAISQYKVSRSSSELLVTRSLKQDGEDWIWTADPRLKLGSPVRFTMEQSLAFIQSITCPTQVVYAGAGEIIEFIHTQQRLLSNMTFHSMTGTHHLHMDGQVKSIAAIALAAIALAATNITALG